MRMGSHQIVRVDKRQGFGSQRRDGCVKEIAGLCAQRGVTPAQLLAQVRAGRIVVAGPIRRFLVRLVRRV